MPAPTWPGHGRGATDRGGRAGDHVTGFQGLGEAAQGAGGNGSSIATLAVSQPIRVKQDPLIAGRDALVHGDLKAGHGAQFLAERQAGFGEVRLQGKREPVRPVIEEVEYAVVMGKLQAGAA